MYGLPISTERKRQLPKRQSMRSLNGNLRSGNISMLTLHASTSLRNSFIGHGAGTWRGAVVKILCTCGAAEAQGV